MQDPSFPTDIGNTSVRIGLIRHFPVVEALPKGWLTASELDAWRRRYDASGVLPGDTLVVSHAGMMRYLSAELRRRGFVGPSLRIPQHAKLYLYERS